jgi:hypothetical protein
MFSKLQYYFMIALLLLSTADGKVHIQKDQKADK